MAPLRFVRSIFRGPYLMHSVFAGALALASCASEDGRRTLSPDEPSGVGGSVLGTGGTVALPPGTGSGPNTVLPDMPWADPERYELPPDFTATQSGGFKLVDVPPSDDDGCNGEMVAVLRDFATGGPPNGWNFPTEAPKPADAPLKHPDFETFVDKEVNKVPQGGAKGIVQSLLGEDQKPVYANIDDGYTTGPAAFDDWYRDKPGTNFTFYALLSFKPLVGGVFTFESNSFFPLDPPEGYGTGPGYAEGMGFGFEGLSDASGNRHNFGFTTELHTEFKYRGGEVFRFEGDDDIWVFLNGRLALDLGGTHAALKGEIDLDAMKDELGLVQGQSYALDFFHAERHTGHSTFRIDTTLTFTNCGVVIDPIVK